MPYAKRQDRINYLRKYQRRTEYQTGKLGEFIANLFLKNSILSNNKNTKYDLIWENKKVEVKTANLSVSKLYKFCTFKEIGLVDFFFFICMENKIPLKAYLIPSDFIKTKYVGIGKYKSKYDKFLYYG